jgi:hypothetical protein
MTTQSSNIKPDIIQQTSIRPDIAYIEDLLTEIKNGELRVPDFQRPFVWKPEDMLSLFESIYKGYPIGSFLFWETDMEIKCQDKVGPIPMPNLTIERIDYILDGHQRLATLCTLLLQEDYPKNTQQNDWRWWIWFDLKGQEFVHLKNMQNIKPHYLPIRAILKTVDFLKAVRQIQEVYKESATQFINVADQLVNKIMRYKVTFTRIKGGDLNNSVEIFSRLNKKGQEITPEHMVSALTYKEEYHLSQKIDEIIEELAVYNFDIISRMTIFRTILVIAGVDIRVTDWNKVSKILTGEKKIEQTDFKQVMNASHEAVILTTKFLINKLNISNAKLLPYPYQFISLCNFFHFCPNPDSSQMEILKKWFWATSFSGWFSNLSFTQTSNAINEMGELAKKEINKPKIVSFNESARPFPIEYNIRSSRVRSLLLFMLTLNPMDTESGMPINSSHIITQDGNIGRIFTGNVKEIINSSANRIFLKNKPEKTIKDQLLSIPYDRLDDVLKSHAISQDAYNALKSNNPDEFIKYRMDYLMEFEKNFIEKMGIKISEETPSKEAEIDTD